MAKEEKNTLSNIASAASMAKGAIKTGREKRRWLVYRPNRTGLGGLKAADSISPLYFPRAGLQILMVYISKVLYLYMRAGD